MTRSGIALALVLSLAACDAAPAAPGPAAEAPAREASRADEGPGHEGSSDDAPGEHVRLGVPPRQIHRARREAVGLYRMPEGLRRQTLEARRAERALAYRELRADADAHARQSVSFEGRVGLVRSAGPRLWILALHTRRDGERWRDPLYVLSVVPPRLPPDGGATARIDGWVVGERTIGRHALPLIVAYHVERTDAPPEGPEPAIRAVY